VYENVYVNAGTKGKSVASKQTLFALHVSYPHVSLFSLAHVIASADFDT